MKLSLNSWHVKVYELTYSNHRLPDNLCPYFWKFVSAFIIMVAIGWFYLLAAIIEKIVNLIRKENEMDFISEGFFSEFFGVAFVGNIIGYILLSSVLVWKDFTNKTWLTGFLLLCAGIIITIIVLIVEHRKKIKESRPRKPEPEKIYKEPEPSIFIEFVKAKYNKYCPQIKWVNNEQNVKESDTTDGE